MILVVWVRDWACCSVRHAWPSCKHVVLGYLRGKLCYPVRNDLRICVWRIHRVRGVSLALFVAIMITRHDYGNCHVNTIIVPNYHSAELWFCGVNAVILFNGLKGSYKSYLRLWWPSVVCETGNSVNQYSHRQFPLNQPKDQTCIVAQNLHYYQGTKEDVPQ